MSLTYSQQAYGARAVALTETGLTQYVAGDMTAVAATNRLLLETGDYILMENSDFIAQE
jgi:hypothetical protein